MYYYIFEPPQAGHDYERMAQVKEYLSTLGIAGEMTSPTPGKSIEDLVQAAIHKRYSTVVAVGGSALINRVARALEPHEAVFGIIPLHEHPDITAIIGVSDWKGAAEQLKKRRLRLIQLGLYNNSAGFLTPATLALTSEQRFVIEAPRFTLKGFGGRITIVPENTEDEEKPSSLLRLSITYPQAERSGFLSTLFRRTERHNQDTLLSLPTLKIHTDPTLTMSVADNELGSTPAVFTVQHKTLKLIVAKGSSH